MKSNFIKMIVIAGINILFFFIYSISTYANDMASSFSCETGCIELEINGGVGPYEVEYQRWNGIDFVTVSGWPKSNLSGNDGNQNLCGLTMAQSGDYKVIVIDAMCGYVEATIKVNACCINKFELESIKMATECYFINDENPGGSGSGIVTCDGEIVVDVDVEGRIY